MSLTDLSANIGVLRTAHSIFKRWRHQFRSNDLFREIKFVLEQFSAPYLEFFKVMIDITCIDICLIGHGYSC